MKPLLVLILLSGFCLTSSSAQSPDLTGTVQTEAGRALANATVFIYTAGPKVGVGTLCPSCYADCRKSARSGADGTFKIGSLDPALLFRLLVLAPGHRPKFVTKIDPVAGPVRVSLVEKKLDGFGLKQRLIGRVVNQKGEPVEGAKIEFEWVETNDGQGCGGVCDEWGVEPLAVTDSDGEFLITAKKPFDRMSVSAEGRALAKGKFPKLVSGKKHELRLGEGASVSGRIVRGGAGVARTTVGLVSVDRGPEGFTGDYQIDTNDEGRFAFATIPPGREYFLYTLMKDAKRSGGVAPVRRFTAGSDGEATTLGDIVVQPAFRVAGRLVMADGSPVPLGARMMIGREQAWDTLPNVDVSPDGSFGFEGVPKETVSIFSRVKGYKLSLQNPSLDRLNGYSIVGRVERNIDDLLILLEEGQFVPDYDNPGPEPQRYNQPLRPFKPKPSP